MRENLGKGVVASAGVSLITAGINLIGTDLKAGVVLIGAGILCFWLYTHLVEKQAIEKAFQVLNQALDERLEKAKQEIAQRRQKKRR